MKNIAKFTKLIFAFSLLILAKSEPAHANKSRFPYWTNEYSNHYIDAYQSNHHIFPLTLSLYLDPTFSASAQNVIRGAAQIFLDHALKPEVINCAYRNSTKDLPTSRTIFETNQLLGSLMPQSLNDDGEFYVTPIVIGRFWDEANVAGLGFVDFFKWPGSQGQRFTPRNKHFYIALNSDYLGNESRYYRSTDSAFWAGVIAHEVLHNLGYLHPTGYEDSFINEYGWCLTQLAQGRSTIGGSNSDRDFGLFENDAIFLPQ